MTGPRILQQPVHGRPPGYSTISWTALLLGDYPDNLRTDGPLKFWRLNFRGAWTTCQASHAPGDAWEEVVVVES